MSGTLTVVLEHEQALMEGIFTFDGETVEIFGFNDVHSVRLPVALLEGATANLDKGLLKQPNIVFAGRPGFLGHTRAIDPPDELKPEIERFAAAVDAAAKKAGGRFA
jgi:hypothetical protein